MLLSQTLGTMVTLWQHPGPLTFLPHYHARQFFVIEIV